MTNLEKAILLFDGGAVLTNAEMRELFFTRKGAPLSDKSLRHLRGRVRVVRPLVFSQQGRRFFHHLALNEEDAARYALHKGRTRQGMYAAEVRHYEMTEHLVKSLVQRSLWEYAKNEQIRAAMTGLDSQLEHLAALLELEANGV